MNAQILTRRLNVLTLLVYYFSTVVGVGIFIVPLLAAKTAGPASIISWLVVFLFAYPFAIIFAHISQKYKVSGSIQKFLEDTWGDKFGRAIALFLIISAMFGNALLAFSAARYFMELTQLQLSPYYLGCALMIFPCLFNLLNVGTSSKLQTLCLFILVILVEFIVIAAVPSFDVANVEPFAPNGFSAIVPAIMLCFYSVTGWENVDAMAEEVRDPARTYPKAVKLSLICISLFYLSLIAAMLLTLSHVELLQTKTILTALLNKTLGEKAATFGGVIAIVLLLLGANAWVFGTSRLIFALARDKVLPGFLSKLSRNNIPHFAVIIQMLFYFALSVTLGGLEVDEDVVVEITSLNYLLLYTLVFFSSYKAFKGFKYRNLSAVAMVTTAVLFIQTPIMKIGVSVVLLLACFFFVYFVKRGKRH